MLYDACKSLGRNFLMLKKFPTVKFRKEQD